MLSEIAAEVLRFLDRDQLDSMCYVNKWLTDLIASACSKAPLRPVRRLELVGDDDDDVGEMVVLLNKAGEMRSKRLVAAKTLAEILPITIRCVEQSFIEFFTLRLGGLRYLFDVSADDRDAVLQIVGTVVARRITLQAIDFTEFPATIFHDLLKRVHDGTEELTFEFSRIPHAFITDAFIRDCLSKGIRSLRISSNSIRGGKYLSVSEKAVLDFCFPTESTHGGPQRSLEVSDCRLSSTFLHNFFQVRSDSVGLTSKKKD